MMISEPHSNDVLCGRGNTINSHPGNVHYRSVVNRLKLDYVKSRKPDKKVFAEVVVQSIRSLNPPGRFLKQDKETKLWYDIGDKSALTKARQALREDAPRIIEQYLTKMIRQQVQEEQQQQQQQGERQSYHHQRQKQPSTAEEPNQSLTNNRHQTDSTEAKKQVSEHIKCVNPLYGIPRTFGTLGPLRSKRNSFNANSA